MTALVSLILAFALVLISGASVAAAQDDLPGQSLYSLKLWAEDARLAMTGNRQAQATLLMTMAQTRVEEMAALTDQGITPPDRVRERLEKHLDQTLRLAADMDETNLEGTLVQLRERLQKQDRLMQQLQDQAGTETALLITQTRDMLQLNLRLVDQALTDPQGFRNKMKNKLHSGPDAAATPGPDQQGEPGLNRNNPTAQPTHEPGPGNGNGNCNGNGAPCDPKPGEPGGPKPDKPKEGNGDGNPGHEEPGGPKDGNGSEGDNSGGGGSGGGGDHP